MLLSLPQMNSTRICFRSERNKGQFDTVSLQCIQICSPEFCTHSESLSQMEIIISGAGAGMTEALANCPFELVKVRMQSKENLGVYKSTSDAARTIMRVEGPLALYKVHLFGLVFLFIYLYIMLNYLSVWACS